MYGKAVVNQPRNDVAGASQHPTNRWSSRMLDCTLDKKICLCGLFCPCILACQMAEKYGECFCLPLLPGSMMMLRTGMRERYNIPGSIVDDWAVATFCEPCTRCQMARDMKNRLI